MVVTRTVSFPLNHRVLVNKMMRINSALMHLQKVSMNEEECDVAIDHIIPRKDNLYFMYDSPI